MSEGFIEPATGASTWALGSHRWVKNMGIFTIKTTIKLVDVEMQRCNVTLAVWGRMGQGFLFSKFLKKGSNDLIIIKKNFEWSSLIKNKWETCFKLLIFKKQFKMIQNQRFWSIVCNSGDSFIRHCSTPYIL